MAPGSKGRWAGRASSGRRRPSARPMPPGSLTTLTGSYNEAAIPVQSLYGGRPCACEISVNWQPPAGDDPSPRPIHRYEEHGVDRCDGIAVYLQSPLQQKCRGGAENFASARLPVRRSVTSIIIDSTRQLSSYRMNNRSHGRGCGKSARETYPRRRSARLDGNAADNRTLLASEANNPAQSIIRTGRETCIQAASGHACRARS